ncbi:non-LTR retroelement reverse transcriptase-like related protein, partial [Trifolium medium]|nr:non-LTR retroelement reverse transcriptase-like related protein [Trifolium medium]
IRTQESLSVCHLQFADDTLLLGVNFHKSMLVGVNISDSWLYEVASALRCRVGKVSFLYLGLSIGGNPTRLGIWAFLLVIEGVCGTRFWRLGTGRRVGVCVREGGGGHLCVEGDCENS